MRLVNWRRKQGLTLEKLAQLVGEKSTEMVRRHCLPPHHPDHRVPRKSIIRRYYLLSGGKVTANDFHDFPVLPRAAAKSARRGASGGRSRAKAGLQAAARLSAAASSNRKGKARGQEARR